MQIRYSTGLYENLGQVVKTDSETVICAGLMTSSNARKPCEIWVGGRYVDLDLPAWSEKTRFPHTQQMGNELLKRVRSTERTAKAIATPLSASQKLLD